MAKAWTGAAAVLACWLLTGTAAAAERYALVVGNDRGLSDDEPLRFAEEDAAALATTLTEACAVPPGHVRLLRGADLDQVRAALSALAHEAGPDDEVFVFFSGHGDRAGAHLRGESWPWAEIKRALDALPGRVVIAFLDACQSGAVLAAKGFVRGPPLQLALEPIGPRGRFIVTSSGASEVSYESTLLQGSPFSHFVISGLRGAADEDGDGRVTLPELYRYLYAHTLASTLPAPAGPQHVDERLVQAGPGEVVLATASRSLARVTRRSSALGTCYLLDADEARVLAELDARAGGSIFVPPGPYRLKCLRKDELLTSKATIPAGGLWLEDLTFIPEARAYALAKGPGQLWTTRAGAEVGALALAGSPLQAFFSLRLRRVRGSTSWDVQLGSAPWTSQLLGLAGVATSFPWWQVGDSQLELGLEAGAAVKGFQASSGAALVGPSLRLSEPWDDGKRGFVSASLLTTLDWRDPRPRTSEAISAGVEFDFPDLRGRGSN